MNESLTEQVPNRWHKNYTRLMPYYYVNKKAKLITKEKEEKNVRVRKVIKTKSDLIIEIAEKIDPNLRKEAGEKKSRKKLKESSLTIKWDDLLEISYQTIKTTNWTLEFIR